MAQGHAKKKKRCPTMEAFLRTSRHRRSWEALAISKTQMLSSNCTVVRGFAFYLFVCLFLFLLSLLSFLLGFVALAPTLLFLLVSLPRSLGAVVWTVANDFDGW